MNESVNAVTSHQVLLEVVVSQVARIVGLVVVASLAAAGHALADGGASGSGSSTYAGVRLGYGWLDTAARSGTSAEHGYDADGAIGTLVVGHDYA